MSGKMPLVTILIASIELFVALYSLMVSAHMADMATADISTILSALSASAS